MARLLNLFLATGLAILPISAFAQQSTTSAQPNAVAAQGTGTDAKAPVSDSKASLSTKATKANHAKLGTRTPAAAAKSAEPGKS